MIEMPDGCPQFSYAHVEGTLNRELMSNMQRENAVGIVQANKLLREWFDEQKSVKFKCGAGWIELESPYNKTMLLTHTARLIGIREIDRCKPDNVRELLEKVLSLLDNK